LLSTLLLLAFLLLLSFLLLKGSLLFASFPANPGVTVLL
jgi:hypothetical protein